MRRWFPLLYSLLILPIGPLESEIGALERVATRDHAVRARNGTRAAAQTGWVRPVTARPVAGRAAIQRTCPACTGGAVAKTGADLVRPARGGAPRSPRCSRSR